MHETMDDGDHDGHEDDHVHQLRLSAEVVRMIKETSARRVQELQGHGGRANGGGGDEASFRAESRVLVWAIAMLHLDIATVVIELSASPLRMLLLGFRLLQTLKKSKIAKRFLAQKLRIMEVSKDYEERAIKLLHEEAPEWFLEMNGMFQLRGIPYISLSFKQGGSFWLKKGEVKNRIRIIHYDGGARNPYAMIEKNGVPARINLSSSNIKTVPYYQNIPGGGIFFLFEAVPGEAITLPVLGTNGKVITMEICADIH